MIKLKSLVKSISEYKSLIESPMKIGAMNMSQLEDNSNNYAFTSEIKNKVRSNENFDAYKIYSYKSGDSIYDLFVDGDYTIALFSYTNKDNTMIEKRVWQEGSHIGLCRKILLKYYLNKFNEIISDGLHTELGEKYWKKLILNAIDLGYKTSVFLNGKYLNIDLSNLDQYFTLSPKSQEVRFLIRK